MDAATPAAGMTSKPKSGMEQDLDAIQKKYRELEIKQKAQDDCSMQTIRMQYDKISKLKSDNKRLKDELDVETRQMKMSLTSERWSSDDDFYSSNALVEAYQSKNGTLKEEIEDLTRQTSAAEAELLKKREQMGGIYASRDNDHKLQREIRLLENKLDKALVKYNEALGYNRKLGACIDNQRREREVFDGIFKKAQLDLEHKKQDMERIIKEAEDSYKARDDFNRQLEDAKIQADREQNRYTHQWDRLASRIEDDRQTSMAKDSGGNVTKNATERQCQKLRQQLNKMTWKIASDKASIKKEVGTVAIYEDKFDRIRKACLIDDMHELAQTFDKCEKTNFELFNDVSEIASETEKTEDRISTILQEIRRMEEGVGQQTERDRQKILKTLEDKLGDVHKKTKAYTEKSAEYQTSLDSIRDTIKDIVKQFDMDAANTIIETQGVTENNMTCLLGMLEEMTEQLIAGYEDAKGVEQEAAPTGPTGDDFGLDDTQVLNAKLGIGIQNDDSQLFPYPNSLPSLIKDFDDESAVTDDLDDGADAKIDS